jgi:hypothetical protein
MSKKNVSKEAQDDRGLAFLCEISRMTLIRTEFSVSFISNIHLKNTNLNFNLVQTFSEMLVVLDVFFLDFLISLFIFSAISKIRDMDGAKIQNSS